jgi:hypothetical protein
MVSKTKAKTKTKTKKIVSKRKHGTKGSFPKAPFLIGSLAVLFAVAVFGFYIFVHTHQIFSANFADDVLRPAIGNWETILIEAFFFKIEDRVNQTKYFFVKPNTGTFTPSSTGAIKKIAKNEGTKFILQKITPLSTLPPLADEGVWKSINVASSDAVMAETFFRPDSQRDYSIAYLVKMNMNRLILSEVAGIKEPGGYMNPGPGKIPIESQKGNSLVAAFNGGFQNKDGHYGMIVGDRTYLPLQKNLATLVIYKNSKLKIINYTGQDLGKDVIAVRQNGPILLQDSKDVSSSNAWNMQSWGLTTTNSMYTWRSGIGITKNGDLIYAAGPSLIPETLAAALKAAGAVDAMQLDINPVWVRFVIFNPLDRGKYKYYSLTDNMINGGYQYLFGYQKDFFYLLKK